MPYRSNAVPKAADVAVSARGLGKRYGKTTALRGVDLTIPRGTVCGLLGPNGAGKTTIVRILATLLRPDAGTARVDGYDVVREAAKVRSRIGLTGQYAAVDELLTGYANLEMAGRLYRLSRRAARRRADELLSHFGLADAGGRLVKTYSGGMRRRLDLAVSLVTNPPVLFLDEPTTGLDPHSRFTLWEVIGDLVAAGTTVLLTTQYLEEADRLAHQIVVIDSGRLVASGSPDELKAALGGERVDLVVRHPAQLAQARSILAQITRGEVMISPETRRVTAPLTGGASDLVEVIRGMDAGQIAIEDITVRRPTLDEVFIRLTGQPVARDERQDAADQES